MQRETPSIQEVSILAPLSKLWKDAELKLGVDIGNALYLMSMENFDSRYSDESGASGENSMRYSALRSQTSKIPPKNVTWLPALKKSGIKVPETLKHALFNCAENKETPG